MKAIIFDLDGTLLDRDTSVQYFIRDQYHRWKDRVKHIPEIVYVERFITLDAQGYVWKDRVYQQMIEELNINANWQELLDDYLMHFKNHCVPFTNLKETLEDLKQEGYKLGLLSNGPGQFQMDNIKALGIGDHFETIAISEWEGIKKPNVDIFHRTAERMGVSPEACVYVGDHLENDVVGARKAGMSAVWKHSADNVPEEADGVIHQLDELKPMIKQIETICI